MFVSEILQIAVAAPLIAASLTYWDAKILPELQHKKILPYRSVDLKRERISRLEAAKTMTPLTCAVLPTLEQIEKGADKCHFIGAHENVRQYICVSNNKTKKKYVSYDLVCTNSPEFEEFLGKSCCVEKRFYVSDEIHDLTI